ncbi:polyprenyl synthetase family protein [Hwanghaeella grinnelliae]|uniref:Octaprenyl diphosphate synthase n=1 Tax=Hwanghaeella grinnelliae TaxID=2500179 RepID=A0A3S2VL52_9PROT|nr:polyprenyl synthetase family protein [Hwanghaeella grinnelliae]RVU34763.1 polyprenyl synthetase family protein [Hwanghaeella grinnelliae]
MGIVVDINKDREGGQKPSIDALQRLVGEDLQRVNQHILTNMQSPVALIPQLASHLIAAGGKRLRPMLTLASANLCGYTGTRHIGLSACVEFIHTATLLHDDVVDESELRRGQESANAVWGNQASVLVGDFLFSRAFQLMVADGSLQVLKILSDASAIIAEGEVLQLMTANDPQASEEAYLEVIRSKTATLFAAASRVGAVVADRPNIQEEALESFGMNLGIAFQLIDDVLDYSAKQAQLGKTVGDDFREGKVTLPVILAWRRGSEEERDFWRRTIERLDQTEDDIETAIGLMTKHRSLNDTVERARHYAAIAKDSLGIFPDGDMKAAMLEVVDFCVERAY